jgi:hypothetical protein
MRTDAKTAPFSSRTGAGASKLSRWPPETLRDASAESRVGLNDAGQTEQAWPEPSHPCQQCPVTPTQPQTVRCTPQGNVELMPKKEILDFKPAPRLEQIGDKRPKQIKHKHRGG